MTCRLCGSDACNLFATDGVRRFVRCNSCQLVFVPDEDIVSADDEKKRYALHDNTSQNAGYLDHLAAFADDIGRVPLPSPRILDFGCGPEMMLSRVLSERGGACESYDPLFEIGVPALDTTYDIVALCEVIEHMRDIRKELDIIKRLLNHPGYVVVRTELYNENTDFETWWYARDITHVNFFRLTTMIRVAEYLSKGLFFTNGRNVAVFG